MLILSRSKIIILLDLRDSSINHLSGNSETHLEEVLLIAQALFLLLPELIQTVVVPIIVHELVIPLGATLADLLADIIELLAWVNDSRIDKIQLWR